MVRTVGVEPTCTNYPSFTAPHIRRLGYVRTLSESGTSYRIRTCDPRLRRPMLYPAELRTRKENGAGNETRTRDIHVGNVVLYQLSYSRMVLRAGIEPARPHGRQILSLMCLPISPPELSAARETYPSALHLAPEGRAVLRGRDIVLSKNVVVIIITCFGFCCMFCGNPPRRQ